MASSLSQFQVALRLCEDHDKKELIAYCKTCEKKICSSCIKEDHTSHDWETITDILREKRRTLPEKCKQIRVKKLPGLKKEIDRFDRKIREEDIRLGRNKSDLNSSRQRCIDKVNRLFDDRIDECQEMSEATKQIYKEKRDGLKQKVEYLEMMTTSLDKDINTLPDHDILDMEREMGDKLEKALSYTADKYTCTTVFVPGEINEQTLEKMIGKIDKVTLEEIYDNDRYSDVISSVKPLSVRNAWVRLGKDEHAKLLDITGKERKTLKSSCLDLIISRNEKLVITDFNKRVISILARDTEIIRTIDTKPLHPTFISKTENDDILVTLVDDGEDFNLVQTSRRVVQRMTLMGKVLHTYEFREDGKTRLFTLPIRTAENNNTDVCVVNVLSDDSGELVVLHKDGRVKFTYRDDGVDSEKFMLVDVECDDKCCILFTELYSRSINILSAEGLYLCTLCQFEQLLPLVIAILSDNLWRGFGDGRLKVFKYK